MKQEIYRYPNGRISYITNYNNSGQRHTLKISYYPNGSIWLIRNWFNDKLFGLITLKFSSNEIYQKYYL